MILLIVKEKGTVVDIPGTKKVRTPANIDITNVDINFVTMYLRKQGIQNYDIVSVSDTGHKEVLPSGPMLSKNKKQKEDTGWKQDIEERFNKLESLLVNLLGRKQKDSHSNSEQITNKLQKLEKLSEEIIRKQTSAIPMSKAKRDAPTIEELEDQFIPSIDIEGMTMKGSTIKTLQSDSEDADEAADLLSSIVKDRG